ncbi:hypothetical protein FIBSPDRAFT_862932 [Athelia psychrophila]|uniref:Uncharacterized protein n=1 Tax=Athelia psychrophila TaxID=1759441 RepID=A0A166HVD8_9AGAM|nr:hypothetical protein FIBSPDRAFT_862932 [Fibularhizoctonia sp. CBS 109695]
MRDNDSETLEHEKARAVSELCERRKTLHRDIDSAPEWTEKPVSLLEVRVKADRHPHEGSVKDLQQETAEKHRRAHEERNA